MDVASIIIAAGIPSAVMAVGIWIIEHRMEKREKEHEKQEAALEKSECLMVTAINASIALGESTARAVQRIPDAHCNGDMDEALKYATQVKHDLKNFLTEQGISNIY